MSNTLSITVVELKIKGKEEKSFGFIASDSYASCYADNWSSWADFYETYPSKQSLIDYVLSQEGFTDIDPEGGIRIFVEGYDK